MEYDEHYLLQEAINKNPQIIPAPELYNFDDERIYAAQMDRLAQPLPSGEESPFSSVTPGSGHALLISVLTHLQGILAHELNLTADRTWVQFFRMIGVEISPPEYPVINIVFYRTAEAIRNNLNAVIPLGTQVFSTIDNTLFALTLFEATIDNGAEFVVVPARLSRIGAIPNIRRGEFSLIPRLLSFVERAENDGTIVSEGRNSETLVDAMLRAREQLKTGDRCVTPRDYYFWTQRILSQMGATNTKVNVVPRVAYGAEGVYNDLITIVVYPATAVTAVKPILVEDLSMSDARIDVIGAELIAVEGTIEVRALPNLSDSAVRNLCAQAIVAAINPPNGTWGDPQVQISIARALEAIEGIYAAPRIDLTEVGTGVPIADLDVRPWHLFEIQESIKIVTLR